MSSAYFNLPVSVKLFGNVLYNLVITGLIRTKIQLIINVQQVVSYLLNISINNSQEVSNPYCEQNAHSLETN